MQWFIDIVLDLAKAYTDAAILAAKVIPSGTVIMWTGTWENIPDGWVSCDGTLGTPDLRALFIRAAGSGIVDNATGGSLTHNHTGDITHNHDMVPGTDIAAGGDYGNTTDTPKKGGWTGTGGDAPPYHALRYIMKL